MTDANAQPTLFISLLGAFQLTHSAMGPVKETRRKVQALMAWLAVEAEQVHSREQLATLLWPEMSLADGRNNLRVSLSRLKKHLIEPAALEATRADVFLHQSPLHVVDLFRFESLIKATETHAHQAFDTCDHCQADLREAIDLYRGEFLAGLHIEEGEAFEEWLFVWRERLQVLILSQMSRLAEADIANGRWQTAEEMAQRQIKLNPLQESAHRQLMRIAAEKGDRSQALHHYHVCTRMLDEELGIQPEEETEALKTAIERGEFSRLIESRAAATPKTSLTGLPALPQINTPFVGREAELVMLAERFSRREYRLISLVGPGGIGKSRLALQAARNAQPHFKDGVYFVPLVGLSSASDLPAAVAEATGLQLASDGLSAAKQVATYLHSKELLLVIDNLEHIIDGADFLIEWLEQAPQLVLLVTTRERINAQAEDLFRLKGLPYPDDRHDPDAARYESVRLFGDRAHRLDKSFSLNGMTLPYVVRICQQVEGLPLALELIATSIRDYEIEEIVDSLGQDPELLATDFRDVPTRHRAFEAVFDYSWALLTPVEQRLLAQLSLFAGGFTRRAARTITGAALTTLTHLNYKSLIRTEGNGRYSMHELLRQLAAKKLADLPELLASTDKAHANYYIEWVIDEGPKLDKADAAATANMLKLDLDNIRAAWRSAVRRLDANPLQRLVPLLANFYGHIGLDFEAESLIEGARSTFLADQSRLPKKLDLLFQLHLLEFKSGHLNREQFQPLFDHFLTQLEGWQDLDRKLFHAKAQYYYCDVIERGSGAESAREETEKALQLAYLAEDPAQLGFALCSRAFQYFRISELDKAIDLLEEALALFESIGHLKGKARAVYSLAPAYSENGSFWKGYEYDMQALQLYQQLGYERKIAIAHFGLSLSYSLLGAFDLARWHVKQSQMIFQKIGDEMGTYYGYSTLAEADVMEGKFESGIKLYNQSLAYWRSSENYERLCSEAVYASRSLWLAGRLEEAEKLVLDALDWLTKFDYRENLHAAQIVQANIYWDQGKHQTALNRAAELAETAELNLMQDPIKTGYELYRILALGEHPKKGAILSTVYDIMKGMAAEMTEDALLHGFLYLVPQSRWLIEAFEKNNLPKIAPHISPGRDLEGMRLMAPGSGVDKGA